MNFYNRKSTEIFLVVFFVLFFMVRFQNLDRDLPPYEITQFGSKDEQGYNFTTLNLYHFGSFSKEIKNNYIIEGKPHTILNNIFTYLSLNIFGNNYYGLRFGSIFVSLLIIIFIFKFSIPYLNKLIKKHFYFYLILLCTYLVTDFGFFVASRNAAPVIFRSFYLIMLIAYLNFIEKRELPWMYFNYFLLGIISALLIFFSYLTNTFIILGIILFIIMKGYGQKNIRIMIISQSFLFGGIIIGSVLSDWIYKYSIGKGVFNYILQMSSLYGDRVVAQKGLLDPLLIIKSSIYKTISLITSNMFQFNLTLLFVVLFFLIVSSILIIKKSNLQPLHMISFSFILGYIFQAIFYNPHPSKWIIMIFPVMIIFLIFTSLHIYNERLFTAYKDLIDKRKKLILLVIALIFALGVFSFYLSNKNDGPLETELFVVKLFSLGILISFLISTMYYFYYRIKRSKKIIIFLIIISIIPNIYLITKYFLVSPEYYYRDTLIGINKIIGSKVVAGSWSDGFRLYGDGNTLFPWNHSQNIEQYRRGITDIFDKGIAEFTVDYNKRDCINVLTDIDTLGKNYKISKYSSFYLGNGAYRDSVILYQRIKNE